MQVPLLDLKAQYASIREDIRGALDRVLESQRFILGPEVEAFEREIAAYCRTSEAIGVSSGTDALLSALMAVDIRPGDEVITSPYSFFATAGEIARLGARPVFADIDSKTYNIDPEGIEGRITPRTRAIIPVHLFGQMADMPAIMEIAKRRKLYVIEDAAQAIGAERHGLRAGSAGDLGCFSFFPSKNLGGFGDGGMVVTDDGDVAESIRMMRNCGQKAKNRHELAPFNHRLDTLQAAILRTKLRFLERWNESRRRIAGEYDELLENCAVVTPASPLNSRHVYHVYVIRSSQRDALQAHLREHGIGSAVHYPTPVHMQPFYQDQVVSRGQFPVAERLGNEVLSLPMYPFMPAEQVQFVAATIGAFPDGSILVEEQPALSGEALGAS